MRSTLHAVQDMDRENQVLYDSSLSKPALFAALLTVAGIGYLLATVV